LREPEEGRPTQTVLFTAGTPEQLTNAVTVPEADVVFVAALIVTFGVPWPDTMLMLLLVVHDTPTPDPTLAKVTVVPALHIAVAALMEGATYGGT
jgi:hypothetical protein